MPNSAKNWCLTINNYNVPCMTFDESTDQYMICGSEKGEKGTEHLQGYVQLKKRTTLATLKQRWPRAHLEVAKGTPEQNVQYCSKEGQSHEHGQMIKGQGRRSDLIDVKKLIDEGSDARAIREANYGAYIRYKRAITSDIEDRRPDRKWPTQLFIIWGETGTGKSRFCAEQVPNAYWKSRGEWWDGYEGHESIIIDEFYGWLPFDFMLRLCDRYPLLLPVKGGFRKMVAKRVIITSNKHYREWYGERINDAMWGALERRITAQAKAPDFGLISLLVNS
ncbi:rep protein [Circoviridae sp.]|nr:rep protein [Circoviridae sp.]